MLIDSFRCNPPLDAVLYRYAGVLMTTYARCSLSVMAAFLLAVCGCANGSAGSEDQSSDHIDTPTDVDLVDAHETSDSETDDDSILADSDSSSSSIHDVFLSQECTGCAASIPMSVTFAAVGLDCEDGEDHFINGSVSNHEVSVDSSGLLIEHLKVTFDGGQLALTRSGLGGVLDFGEGEPVTAVCNSGSSTIQMQLSSSTTRAAYGLTTVAFDAAEAQSEEDAQALVYDGAMSLSSSNVSVNDACVSFGME